MGARHHGYTGQRGYHPLLAIAAGTGDLLMSRLRSCAAHFLRETVGRVRRAGATGQLTVRADSGYAHALVVVWEMDVITIRKGDLLAIPEEDWTPVPYWMDGGAGRGRDHLHSPSRVSPKPPQCGSSSGG